VAPETPIYIQVRYPIMLEKSTRNRITCDSIKQEEFKRMDINIRKNQEFEGFC